MEGGRLEHQKAAGRWSLLGAKLADSKRRVASWCQVPPEKVNFSDEDLQRQRDEVYQGYQQVAVGPSRFFSEPRIALWLPTMPGLRCLW